MQKCCTKEGEKQNSCEFGTCPNGAAAADSLFFFIFFSYVAKPKLVGHVVQTPERPEESYLSHDTGADGQGKASLNCLSV